MAILDVSRVMKKTEQMTSHKAGFHPRISALYGPVLAAVRENSLRFSPELTLEKLRRSTLTVLKANGGGGGGGGIVPSLSYIGMCGPKGCGFFGVLAINRILILADFGHFGHK